MGESVSVVIPVYNREKLIVSALKSVLDQFYTISEIIVVDDGSTDGTVASILALNEPSIKVVSIQNAGSEVARSEGIEHATSKWIAFLDSDDLWEKDHILRLVALQAKYPECEFFFSNFSEFGDTRRYQDKFASMSVEWWPEFHNQTLPDFIRIDAGRFGSFLNANPVFPSACLFSKALYERVGGIHTEYSRIRSADADFVRRCSVVARFACDKRRTTLIRKHEDNISANTAESAMGRLYILSDSVERDCLIGRHKSDVYKAIRKTAITSILGAFSSRNFSLAYKFSQYISWSEMPLSVAFRVCTARFLARFLAVSKES